MSTIADHPAPPLHIPRILVADDESAVLELLDTAISENFDCEILTAANMAEAREIMADHSIDLMVTDLNFPDGSGADLLEDLRTHQPLAHAMVITGEPSVDGAVTALRRGAIDFLAKPFTVDELLNRVRKALKQHARAVRGEHRLERLRGAVRRLGAARKLVTQKVDLLCNDLIGAYGDLTRQLDLVRTGESFRGTITAAADMEQMLCHAMDWLLRKIGYCNCAIFLSSEQSFQLGAYMKHTIPGDGPLIEAMQGNLLKMVARDGLVMLGGTDAGMKLSSAELKFLKNQTILGSHCTYLGESLAQMIVFRDGAKPFTESDAETIRSISPIFATVLATMARHDQEEGEAPPFCTGGGVGEASPESDEESPKRRRGKDDEADWWKRGEAPPF